MDRETQAPSFKLLAGNYRRAPNADRMLERKVLEGGVGHWGVNPMPPAGTGTRPAVSEAESKELVAWILALK
jgi:cytochrome c